MIASREEFTKPLKTDFFNFNFIILLLHEFELFTQIYKMPFLVLLMAGVFAPSTINMAEK